MPLNEAQGYHQTSLTEKQQHEAMAAIYNPPGQSMHPNPQNEWTYEERVRIRQLLDMADQKDVSNSMGVFDLNKPPTAPYVYREYPRLMYHHDTRANRRARDYDEEQQLIVQGWTRDPVPPEVVEVELTALEQEEAEKINAKLEKKRRTT
jgi:hypothetical protein